MKTPDKKILLEMLGELKKAPALYQPSNFWTVLGKTHIQRLFQGGFDDFKRSINMKYFNWSILGILRHQMSPIVTEIKRRNFVPIFKSNFVNPEPLNFVSAFIYRVYAACLWEYVSRIDKSEILNKMDEPLLGRPFLVSYRNKFISQDLSNSVHEFYSIANNSNLASCNDIAEIGTGYGRLAYVFLKTLPKISYTIIDIPPALFISQKYLAGLFPEQKIFYFKPFKSFNEVKNEFESARIRFLMAHQIEYLPDKFFDLIITVSSLHEMTRDQIRNYLLHFDRLAKGYLYTKQWIKSRTRDNNYITDKEYPIPKKWKVVFKRKHPIQSMFFDAVYKIG